MDSGERAGQRTSFKWAGAHESVWATNEFQTTGKRKTGRGSCGQRATEATMFSTMRSARAEIVKKGFTSSADRMITPA
jgi:hypothetical protein